MQTEGQRNLFVSIGMEKSYKIFASFLVAYKVMRGGENMANFMAKLKSEGEVLILILLLPIILLLAILYLLYVPFDMIRYYKIM